jgi:hypothetical protein
MPWRKPTTLLQSPPSLCVCVCGEIILPTNYSKIKLMREAILFEKINKFKKLGGFLFYWEI